jgi:hypothetical protein
VREAVDGHHTPIPYWLSLPIDELDAWIAAAVRVREEDEEANK